MTCDPHSSLEPSMSGVSPVSVGCWEWDIKELIAWWWEQLGGIDDYFGVDLTISLLNPWQYLIISMACYRWTTRNNIFWLFPFSIFQHVYTLPAWHPHQNKRQALSLLACKNFREFGVRCTSCCILQICHFPPTHFHANWHCRHRVTGGYNMVMTM